jgi:hypothetical protein
MRGRSHSPATLVAGCPPIEVGKTARP